MTTPNQQTPTPLTDEFVNKVVSEKGQVGFSVKEIIAIADFAREQELQLQQLQKQNQELRLVLSECDSLLQFGLSHDHAIFKRVSEVLSTTHAKQKGLT